MEQKHKKLLSSLLLHFLFNLRRLLFRAAALLLAGAVSAQEIAARAPPSPFKAFKY
jgi:hypothetical protein